MIGKAAKLRALARELHRLEIAAVIRAQELERKCAGLPAIHGNTSSQGVGAPHSDWGSGPC